jgi:hypothetical protein
VYGLCIIKLYKDGVFILLLKVVLLTLVLIFPLVNGNIMAAENTTDKIEFNPSQAFDTDFYVESNLEFTLLHELAHAVIELHDIPVLGGQEQAADQVALMLLLTDRRHKGVLTPIIMNKLLAISGEWMLEWQAEIKNSQAVYWDTHPLTIQRFYDVTCLAYGSNPDLLESLRKDYWLPVERAWNCDTEFNKTRKALAWLAQKVSHYRLDEHWQLVKKTEATTAFSGKVKIEWVTPSSEAHKALANKLKNFSSLRYLIKQTNQVINLKQDITIYMEPYCKGPDAWWNGEASAIMVCYELIELFANNAKKLPDLVNKDSYTTKIAGPKPK